MKFILYYSISYKVVYLKIRSTDLFIAVTYKTYQQDSMSPYAASISRLPSRKVSLPVESTDLHLSSLKGVIFPDNIGLATTSPGNSEDIHLHDFNELLMLMNTAKENN